MVNQYIVNYLKENKDKFPIDVLKKRLSEAGYPEKEIEEAINLIQKPISKEIGEYVGFGNRLIAFIIDNLILLGTFLFILNKLFILNRSLNYEYEVYFYFIPYLIGPVYFICMWTFADGATVGKKILKIKIVQVNGSPITIGKAILRYIGYFISGMFFGLGFFTILWNKKKQGWHDEIAKTVVVRNS